MLSSSQLSSIGSSFPETGAVAVIIRVEPSLTWGERRQIKVQRESLSDCMFRIEPVAMN